MYIRKLGLEKRQKSTYGLKYPCLGCEKKRNAPHSLNLTFISKHEPVRTKETPLFGRVLSFSSRELFTKWLAALLVAEYGTDIVQNNLLLLD